ncbi:hypothetical protein [Moraxella lacunata]
MLQEKSLKWDKCHYSSGICFEFQGLDVACCFILTSFIKLAKLIN